jgi:hypothetical protein
LKEAERKGYRKEIAVIDRRKGKKKESRMEKSDVWYRAPVHVT